VTPAARPLLFLPGAGGSARFWRPVAERLAGLGAAHLVGYPGFDGQPRDPAVRSLDDLFGWVVARLPAGRCHVVAQSMGGVLAVRLALEQPARVASLVLAATSGGVDVARLGGSDWRPGFRAERPEAPDWFETDRTDLGDRLHQVRCPVLLLWSDADPISPLGVGRLLEARIPGARLVTFAGGSHAFASERPDEVAVAIRSHLALAGQG
jgi:pimeloyl-ACP methyl ester carboxylesterase